ncbi:SMI1 / KNR4 family (SUKH-1) [Treponema bryantii]|uniref:SMI1 / KNR4 family (SUKH-1) n=1 Tax=Treponema bryantii TaxID=163 RepID=A0A1H9K1C9_9SPIR|nr:SMI1/KNR4 family protein [Treponema bryantii]SEQ92889.1 SMI1 / KNR4 family (SUKH-1) [Treponema bryantii]
MKKSFDRIKEKLMKFKSYGYEEREGCLLIGKPSYLPKYAWLVRVFMPLTQDDISFWEKRYSLSIPDTYKNFLMNFSNGLNIFFGTFSLEGYRKHYRRDESAILQPFALDISNVYERPKNAKENYFFIGSYDWDGSTLYIDTETNHVHLCKREDATSIYEWNSFEEMLSSEIDRIFSLFTEDGHQIDENQSTLPI